MIGLVLSQWPALKILSPFKSTLQGGCQRWTLLAMGLCWGGTEAPATHALRRSDEYLSLSFTAWDGGGRQSEGWRLNKDAQEVILQGYIQGFSINNCLKMAVSWWGWEGGLYFWYWRWPTQWFRVAGRASSTWQQCNKIIRAIRANKNPSNLPQNPDYDCTCCLNAKHGWEGLTGYKVCWDRAGDCTSHN